MYSLPDWAFYPIAALAAAGMVAGALSYGDNSVRSPEEILTDGILFEGDKTFARIDAVRGPFDGIQSAGAFFTLTPGEVQAIQGRRVRLRFTVRTAPEFGAPGVRLNFFAPGVGQNAGEHVETGDQFETFTLEAASSVCSWEFGYIGLWPDWGFESNTIDLERVELTALERLPDCPDN